MAGRARDLTVKGNGHHGDVPGVLAPLARRVNPGRTSPPVDRDPAFIERSVPWVRALTSYFSPEVRGVENLPAEGPVLIVGNHNAVFYMPDMWVTALAIVGRRGFEQPTYAMAYDLLLAIPVVGDALRRFGAVPAARGEAEAALARGAAVLDYPGGDWEACRPWLDRNMIDFGGRTGFARVALRTGVPIVPVVAHGSHDSIVVASRGEDIARALGLGGLRVKVFPIMVGPPFGLATMLNPPLPLPSSITVEFLPPMTFDGLGPADADDPEVVGACAAEVTAAMQGALDRLRVERAHPVWRGFTSLVSRAIPH